MASQSEINRVQNEIEKKNKSWWQQMADNINAFNNWLKSIIDAYSLSGDVINLASQFISYIRGLLG